MFKIGLSSCGKYPTEDLFFSMSESGIYEIELSFPTYEHDKYDLLLAKKNADKYGINIWSYHLPVMPIDIAIDNTNVKSVDYLSEIIKRVCDIGVDKLVLHPGYEPITDEERIDRITCSKQSLIRLADIAEKNGAQIAIENLPRTCLGRTTDEMIDILSCDDRLRACIDINHILRDPIPDFIRAVGKRIVTLHISDCNFVNERHWLPGEGLIDWSAVVDILLEIDYNGIWMYEVERGYDLKSIHRYRNISCADIVRNAEEIFSRKPLTVYSTQKENLGLWE